MYHCRNRVWNCHTWSRNKIVRVHVECIHLENIIHKNGNRVRWIVVLYIIFNLWSTAIYQYSWSNLAREVSNDKINCQKVSRFSCQILSHIYIDQYIESSTEFWLNRTIFLPHIIDLIFFFEKFRWRKLYYQFCIV